MKEAMGLYEGKFGHGVDDEVVEEDGIKFLVTRGEPPSMTALEQSLNEVKGLYNDKFGHTVDEEVVAKDGIQWQITRGAPPSMA